MKRARESTTSTSTVYVYVDVRRRRSRLLPLIIVLVVFLNGCNTVPISEDLSQSQANEIVAALSERGISASATRETGGRGNFTVEIKRNYYTQAITLLQQLGLPGEKQPSFQELISPRGIIPNSREIEALRLDRARAAEIEDLLKSIPGVVSTRVVVRSGNNAGVSVLITTRAGVSFNESEVFEIVTRAVPGVERERIFLAQHDQEKLPGVDTVQGALNQGEGRVVALPLTIFLGGWRVPEDDYNSLALVLVFLMVMLFLLGWVIGFWYSLYRPRTTPQQVAGIERPNLPRSGGREDRKELPGV